MILDFIDQKIRKAFSDAAMQYDVLAGLHKEIGRELIKKNISRENTNTILDVGMGTGWLTGKLSFYFPESKVVGIDFAPGMIKAAKDSEHTFTMIQADALELPFKNNSYDLVISNLVYQWVSPLNRAFGSVTRILKDGGVFSMTAFGYNTFTELFQSINHVLVQKNDGKPYNIKRLCTFDNIKETLAGAGFKNINVDYETIKVHFPDMMSLVKWIKGIGANTIPRDFFIGKDLLSAAEEYYKTHFTEKLGVVATFEVIWAQAQK